MTTEAGFLGWAGLGMKLGGRKAASQSLSVLGITSLLGRGSSAERRSRSQMKEEFCEERH